MAAHRSFALGLARRFVAGSALAALLAPAPAAADPLPRLTVQRTDRTLDCPDADGFAAAVARQMGRPALDTGPLAPPSGGYDVRITRDKGPYSADIRNEGRSDKVRHIDDPGDTCAGLADAVALTLAILLDRGGEQPAPPAPLVQVEPAHQPLLPEARPREPVLAVAAYGLATAGLLSSAAGALAADVEVRPLPALAIGAGAMGTPGATEEVPPGRVAVSLATGFLRACGVLDVARGARLSLCPELFGGAIHGAGTGFPKDGAQTRPWLALGAAAIGSGRLVGPLEWTVRADLVAPLVREKFEVEGLSGLVYDPSPVGGLFGGGLRVVLR